jgi:hypothetical protein
MRTGDTSHAASSNVAGLHDLRYVGDSPWKGWPTSGHPTYSPTQADVAVADTSRMANNVRPSLARRLVTLLHDYDLARKLLADIRQKRRSQSLDDLVRAAAALGFEIDRRRSKDSYMWAIHPGGQKFPIPTTKNPVRVGLGHR